MRQNQALTTTIREINNWSTASMNSAWVPVIRKTEKLETISKNTAESWNTWAVNWNSFWDDDEIFQGRWIWSTCNKRFFSDETCIAFITVGTLSNTSRILVNRARSLQVDNTAQNEQKRHGNNTNASVRTINNGAFPRVFHVFWTSTVVLTESNMSLVLVSCSYDLTKTR